MRHITLDEARIGGLELMQGVQQTHDGTLYQAAYVPSSGEKVMAVHPPFQYSIIPGRFQDRTIGVVDGEGRRIA